MNDWCLVRRSDPEMGGKYDRGGPWFVAAPGAEHSYTRTITKAQLWPSREAAAGSSCGNERPTPVSGFFHR